MRRSSTNSCFILFTSRLLALFIRHPDRFYYGSREKKKPFCLMIINSLFGCRLWLEKNSLRCICVQFQSVRRYYWISRDIKWIILERYGKFCLTRWLLSIWSYLPWGYSEFSKCPLFVCLGKKLYCWMDPYQSILKRTLSIISFIDI